MENQIFQLIINSGGLALSLAILFYYSINSYKQHSKERQELETDIDKLQEDFHDFKNDTIEKLFEIQTITNNILSEFSKNFHLFKSNH